MTDAPRRARRQRPAERSHWIVLSAVLLALLVALVTHGYTHRLSSIGDDGRAPSGSAAHVPAAVSAGGPAIDAREAQPRTARPAPGTDEARWDKARRENPEPERCVPLPLLRRLLRASARSERRRASR